MSQQRYFADVGRIQEITSTSVANQALDEGWELLAIREKTVISRDNKYSKTLTTTEPIYVMGWARSRLASLTEPRNEPNWTPSFHEIKPANPVPVNNGPIGWLRRKLIPSVLRKHTDARIEVIETGGFIQSIRISAPKDELDEIVKDVTSSIEWAFETALTDTGSTQKRLE
jgi:hypothetical protein